MTDPLRGPPAHGRSRLERPPLPRRDFLGLAGLWSAGVALGLAVLGLLRMPKTALLPSPSKRFTIRPPEALAAGSAFIPSGRKLAFYRDPEGVYAISLVCTHLGCIVTPKADGFDCPCHGSVFDKVGAVVRGPAPKGLAWYRVKTEPDGAFLVDEGQTVPTGTKVALEAPASPRKAT